jgi:hypothetical protein
MAAASDKVYQLLAQGRWVSDWLLFKKFFSSETAWPNGAKLGRKHLCKILYKASSFGSIRPANMATKINT